MEPEARAAAGLFLAFQAPLELPGVNNANFLRTALNAVRRARGEDELDAPAFLRLARAESKRLSFPDDMLKRNVNVGLLRRREEAQRSAADGDPAAAVGDPRRGPTAGSTSMRCASWPRASMPCVARASPRWS